MMMTTSWMLKKRIRQAGHLVWPGATCSKASHLARNQKRKARPQRNQLDAGAFSNKLSNEAEVACVAVSLPCCCLLVCFGADILLYHTPPVTLFFVSGKALIGSKSVQVKASDCGSKERSSKRSSGSSKRSSSSRPSSAEEISSDEEEPIVQRRGHHDGKPKETRRSGREKASVNYRVSLCLGLHVPSVLTANLFALVVLAWVLLDRSSSTAFVAQQNARRAVVL
jgi:hypothetical protein